jgi:TIR domain
VNASDAETPYDVFISYHSGDAEWVATLKTALETKGIRIWLDSERIRPGNLFPETLARAIGAVRCVVLVLSRGALASAWVQEEFNLALAHRRRVIAALIDDVAPPGFLAGRTWVDFRDDREFATRVDQLVFGITGEPTEPARDVPAPEYRDADSASADTDEAEVLKRLIARRRHEATRLWQVRISAALVGLAVGVAFLFVGKEASATVRFAVSVLAPIILLLAAWGITATGLTRIDSKVEQFELLRDGLEACRSRSDPGCRRLRQHFWTLIDRAAADISARPA